MKPRKFIVVQVDGPDWPEEVGLIKYVVAVKMKLCWRYRTVKEFESWTESEAVQAAKALKAELERPFVSKYDEAEQ